MADNFAGAGIYLIQTFISLYMLLMMLRLLMQAARVDYYNPLVQGVVRVTDPAVRPFRTMIPTVQGVDFATLAAGLLIQLLGVMLIMTISGYAPFDPRYIAWCLLAIFALILDIYFFALLIMVISSWIAPTSNHPALVLIQQLVEPVCAPARKVLPPMGGIDFSIILVFVVINIVDQFLVVTPLKQFLGVPGGLFLGL